MTEYKVTTHPPSRTHSEQGEIPGHRQGWKKRRSVLNPKDIKYQATCSCGWKDTIILQTGKQVANWSGGRKIAEYMFKQHIKRELLQGTLHATTGE